MEDDTCLVAISAWKFGMNGRTSDQDFGGAKTASESNTHYKCPFCTSSREGLITNVLADSLIPWHTSCPGVAAPRPPPRAKCNSSDTAFPRVTLNFYARLRAKSPFPATRNSLLCPTAYPLLLSVFSGLLQTSAASRHLRARHTIRSAGLCHLTAIITATCIDLVVTRPRPFHVHRTSTSVHLATQRPRYRPAGQRVSATSEEDIKTIAAAVDVVSRDRAPPRERCIVRVARLHLSNRGR
ncbi:hypothetical protein ANO11243_067540 [Dothideomycetidae sp. 11243]|nr:hypothetical protein ANO11243_067540 [fungal sp. No.11243]